MRKKYFANARTITSELMVWLTILVTLIILLFGAINYTISVNQLEQQVEHQSEEILNVVSDSLSLPLWNLDTDAIERVAIESRTTNNIESIRVFNDFEEIIVELETSTSDTPIEYHLDERDVIHEGTRVGHVQIELSKEKIEVAKITIIRSTIVTVILVILTITLATYFIMTRRLTSPLKRIIEGFKEVSKGNFNYKTPRFAQSDIDFISRSFNKMTLDLKKSRAKLEDYSKNLEKKVSQRTEALSRSNKKLTKSNNLKEMFIDIMRHDILNPLTVIRGFSVILLKKRKTKEQERILRSTDAAISIIDNAKKYAKLTGSVSLEKEKQNLKKILSDVCYQIKPRYDTAKVKLINNIKKSMPITANSLISEVFLNFLTNALKYAPEGKQVIVDAKIEKTHYLISVTDFGEGIPAKYKEKIFTRFTRKEKEGVKGSGLGLAIVKELIKAHKGEVWVEDNPKGGCVFVVKLPRK